MKLLRTLMAASLAAATTLAVVVPAQALTARQYQAQGQGRYISSKGRPMGYSAYRHHRRPYGYWRHHRRYR